MILMHVIQPDLSPIDDAVSYYMNGRFGSILGVGLVALGVGSLSLLWALRRLLSSAEARSGSWCLAIWGAGATIGGIFPPDPRGHWGGPPSVSGMIHANFAMLAFLAFPVAAMLLSAAIAEVSGSRRVKPLLRGFALASGVTLLIFVICLAPVFSHHAPHYLGIAERVLLAAYIAWLGMASVAISRAATTEMKRAG
jgi:hypothetical protein